MFWIITLSLVSLFSFVLIFGAPYLPTRRTQGEAALELLNLPKGSHLFELGCGDGRMLRLAASRGLRVTGYELNPLLALTSWVVSFRYRHLVSVVWGSFWKANISEADGIYVFLLDKFMSKLDAKIKKDHKKPLFLVSYAFKVPGKKPAASKLGVFLYVYK